jgi:pyruvate/2-oxoglutarate/acetoin dehydrogenase E1 component
VAPSTPADAKRLLTASIRGENSVIFLEHKHLYSIKEDVAGPLDVEPLGRARVVREGDDLATPDPAKENP